MLLIERLPRVPFTVIMVLRSLYHGSEELSCSLQAASLLVHAVMKCRDNKVPNSEPHAIDLLRECSTHARLSQ
jgi:hypothetical protein